MGEGLPFDIAGEDDKDYTLDLTVVSDDDEDAPCLDEEQEASDLRELAEAKAERERLLEEGEKTWQTFSSLFGQLKDANSVSETTAHDAREEHRRVAALNHKLSAIRDEIRENELKEANAELKLLESTTQKTTYEIKRAIKEKEIESVHRAVCAAESVDLAFVLDATASMRTLISSVRKNIRLIVAQVRRTNPNLNLRLAVVVYRDIEYSRPFEVLDFVKSVEEFETFVAGIQVVREESRWGPRDTPEDIAGGIQRANKLTWQHPTRVVFLIADSPCHGIEFHACGDDNYPFGTPGINIKKQMRCLINKTGKNGTMTVFFGRMTSRTDQMIDRFQKCGLSLNVVGIKDPKKVVNAVTNGVRSSIFKTITATGSNGASAFSFGPVDFDVESLLKNSASGKLRIADPNVRLKRYCVISRLPTLAEWQSQPAIFVKVFNNEPIASIKDLQKPLSVGLLRYIRRTVFSIFKNKKTEEEPLAKESTMVLLRAAAPFAEGSMRIAFHGQLARKEEDLDLEKSNVVMKSFKHIGKGLNGLKQYLRQMELSNIAHFLAKEYNKSRPLICGAVYILKSCVVEEEEEVNEERGTRRFCAEEPLPGDHASFTRYSNNTGYWNVDEMHETLLRFTEFTYHVTNEYLLVTDLQGIQKGGDFYLTDPAILCTDTLRFGHTNLGEQFMKKCLASTKHHLTEIGCE